MRKSNNNGSNNNLYLYIKQNPLLLTWHHCVWEVLFFFFLQFLDFLHILLFNSQPLQLLSYSWLIASSNAQASQPLHSWWRSGFLVTILASINKFSYLLLPHFPVQEFKNPSFLLIKPESNTNTIHISPNQQQLSLPQFIILSFVTSSFFLCRTPIRLDFTAKPPHHSVSLVYKQINVRSLLLN